MREIVKKAMIYFMIGVIQLGIGMGIAIAGSPGPSPDVQGSQNRPEESLSSKIQELRSAMKKNIANTDDENQLSDFLMGVLGDKRSINLLPADIIGDDSNYELKYINEFTVNHHQQRIVQFTHKQGKPFTFFYAQSMEKSSDIITYPLGGEDKLQLVSCNVFSSNNKFYLSLVLKEYGDKIREDAVSIVAYTYEYQEQMTEGVLYSLWTNGPTTTALHIKNKYWRMYSDMDIPGSFWIANVQADSLKGNDFVAKVSGNKMDITLVDQNKQTLDTIQAVFKNGQWQPSEIQS